MAPFVLAAIPSADFIKSKNYGQELGQKIGQTERDIHGLQRRISHLENVLNKKNNHYLKVVEERKQIEKIHNQIVTKLQADQEKLRQDYAQGTALFRYLLINSLEKNDNAALMAGKRVLAEGLKQKLMEIQRAMDNTTGWKKQLNESFNRLEQTRVVEKELSKDMAEMEDQKKEVAENYLELMHQKDTWKWEYQHLALNKADKKLWPQKNEVGPTPGPDPAQVSTVPANFIPPLNAFSGLESGKKGVTFKFRGTNPVQATADGQIIYAGNLSTFGNVIMIDHGTDTRSVILGPFTPKVAKGTQVKKGDILGYTLEKTGEENKLYFEVRKQNKVQNTILLIDRESLTNNNLKAGPTKI